MRLLKATQQSLSRSIIIHIIIRCSIRLVIFLGISKRTAAHLRRRLNSVKQAWRSMFHRHSTHKYQMQRQELAPSLVGRTAVQQVRLCSEMRLHVHSPQLLHRIGVRQQ